MNEQLKIFDDVTIVKESHPHVDIVTRENCERFNHFYFVNKGNGKAVVMHWRRNGKTKLWKTRPNEFKIPVKYGMYDYGYITHEMINIWGSV